MTTPLFSGRVRPEWIDYNGHLSEAYYVLVCGYATDALLARLSMTPETIAAGGPSVYTLEAHVRYLDQISPAADLEVRSGVIEVGRCTVQLWHELWSRGRLRATEEVLGLRVSGARAVPWTQDEAAVLDAHRIEAPEGAGGRVAVRGAGA